MGLCSPERTVLRCNFFLCTSGMCGTCQGRTQDISTSCKKHVSHVICFGKELGGGFHVKSVTKTMDVQNLSILPSSYFQEPIAKCLNDLRGFFCWQEMSMRATLGHNRPNKCEWTGLPKTQKIQKCGWIHIVVILALYSAIFFYIQCYLALKVCIGESGVDFLSLIWTWWNVTPTQIIRLGTVTRATDPATSQLQLGSLRRKHLSQDWPQRYIVRVVVSVSVSYKVGILPCSHLIFWFGMSQIEKSIHEKICEKCPSIFPFKTKYQHNTGLKKMRSIASSHPRLHRSREGHMVSSTDLITVVSNCGHVNPFKMIIIILLSCLLSSWPFLAIIIIPIIIIIIIIMTSLEMMSW